jgi:hypothetical protein
MLGGCLVIGDFKHSPEIRVDAKVHFPWSAPLGKNFTDFMPLAFPCQCQRPARVGRTCKAFNHIVHKAIPGKLQDKLPLVL